MEVLEASSGDGTRIGCELVGEGPPLLAVHGSTADRHRFAAVQARLAESFRLHLMDRRGRGLSAEETPSDYSLEREAEDIRAVVAAIDGPVLVLAHSYGGACALEAVTDCEGIARMLVYEPAFGTPEGPVFPDASQPSKSAHIGGPSRPSPSWPPTIRRNSTSLVCSLASRSSDSDLERLRLRSTSSSRPTST